MFKLHLNNLLGLAKHCWGLVISPGNTVHRSMPQYISNDFTAYMKNYRHLQYQDDGIYLAFCWFGGVNIPALIQESESAYWYSSQKLQSAHTWDHYISAIMSVGSLGLLADILKCHWPVYRWKVTCDWRSWPCKVSRSGSRKRAELH